MAHYRRTGFHVVALMAWGLGPASLSAQVSSYQPPGQLMAANANATAVTGVTVREMDNGAPSPDVARKDGDTGFAPGAKVYVIGRVKNPGAYSLRRTAPTTVLGELALAGGVRSRSRVEIVRTIDGERKNLKVTLEDVTPARRHDPGHGTVLLTLIRFEVYGRRGLPQPARAEAFRTCDRMPWSWRSPSVSAAGPGCRM